MPEKMSRRGAGLAAALMLLMSSAAGRAQIGPAPLVAGGGWMVSRTQFGFADLVQRLERAIAANNMGLVNVASASEGAKAQGIVIPDNRVVGVFRNDFARRMLAASLPAGIEAPIRFYLTENSDGSATLSYRTPSAVFAPYLEAASLDLRALAAELDTIFDQIARDTLKP